MSGITRPMSQLKKMETKEALFRARKRILKYLVLSFLKQENLHRTAEQLVEEAELTGEFQVCDNIDLDIMLQDYCSYYLMRFNKQPLFLKKVEEAKEFKPRRPVTRTKRPNVIETKEVESNPGLQDTFVITQLGTDTPDPEVPLTLDRKPLAGFLHHASAETKELAEMLYRDILRTTQTTWDDIKGLNAAKSLLIESVVYPVKHPSLFTGLLSPWRGVLLHGPPGTGKTALARALSSHAGCTFFNVGCSSVVNKWRGESEKIVHVLFDLASYYAPSIIFIDEIETLTSDRSAPGEHEASRRLKAQLLTELDGIAGRDGVVFLLANSNMPWDIDPAMLRRLEKRIHIPLPDLKTRLELFQTFLSSSKVELHQVDLKELAARTDGYSGSDIKIVCKEALMVSVRKMLPGLGKASALDRKEKISHADLIAAIEKTKPVSKNSAQRHVEWQKQMGCT